jgi:hypothetical protein
MLIGVLYLFDHQLKYCELLLQLPAISIGENVLDLVVIGCGPAGLALAAESAKLGLKVGLIGPDLPFTNNYGVWEDEFKGTIFCLANKHFNSLLSTMLFVSECD